MSCCIGLYPVYCMNCTCLAFCRYCCIVNANKIFFLLFFPSWSWSHSTWIRFRKLWNTFFFVNSEYYWIKVLLFRKKIVEILLYFSPWFFFQAFCFSKAMTKTSLLPVESCYSYHFQTFSHTNPEQYCSPGVAFTMMKCTLPRKPTIVVITIYSLRFMAV